MPDLRRIAAQSVTNNCTEGGTIVATHCYLCAVLTDDFKLVVPADGAVSVPVCRDAPACLNRFLSTIPDAVIAAATTGAVRAD